MTTLDFGPTTSPSPRSCAASATTSSTVRPRTPDDRWATCSTTSADLRWPSPTPPARARRPAARSPTAEADALPDDWRSVIPDRLAALAEAWRDPAAYTGLTMAGPVEMPARRGGPRRAGRGHRPRLGPRRGDRPAVRSPTRPPSRRARGSWPPSTHPPTAACSRPLSTCLTPRRRSTGCSAPPAATPTGRRREPCSRPDQRGRRRRARGRLAGPGGSLTRSAPEHA